MRRGLIGVSSRSGLPLRWERGAAGLIAVAFVFPVVGWVGIALFAVAMVVAMVPEARPLAVVPAARAADRIDRDADREKIDRVLARYAEFCPVGRCSY